MGKPFRLSLADQVLINAAARLVVDTVSDRDMIADDIATLREVLLFTSREEQMIGRLADACDDLEAAHGDYLKTGNPEWVRAKFQASTALCAIFRWRHSLALDAFRSSKENAA